MKLRPPYYNKYLIWVVILSIPTQMSAFGNQDTVSWRRVRKVNNTSDQFKKSFQTNRLYDRHTKMYDIWAVYVPKDTDLAIPI